MAYLRLKAAVCALASAAAWPGASRAQVTISSDTTENMTCTNGVCAPTASEAVLNVTDLENLLATGSVEVTTTGSGVQANDIVIAATLSWTNASSLTLDAYLSISVTQPVAVDGSGAVSLVTNDGGSGGTLSFLSGGALSFAGAKNSLSIDGKAYTLVSSIAALPNTSEKIHRVITPCRQSITQAKTALTGSLQSAQRSKEHSTALATQSPIRQLTATKRKTDCLLT
jgi:hypothetical protein